MFDNSIISPTTAPARHKPPNEPANFTRSGPLTFNRCESPSSGRPSILPQDVLLFYLCLEVVAIPEQVCFIGHQLIRHLKLQEIILFSELVEVVVETYTFAMIFILIIMYMSTITAYNTTP